MFGYEFVKKIASGFIDVIYEEAARGKKREEVEIILSMGQVDGFIVGDFTFGRPQLEEAIRVRKAITDLRGDRDPVPSDAESSYDNDKKDVSERLGRQIQGEMDS